MNYEALSAQIMRALRGTRSQTAFSRRLGYGTNVAYAWEAGRRSPNATVFLQAAERVGIDVRAAIGALLYRQLPGELAEGAPSSSTFVAALLRELRGPVPLRVVAERTNLSISTMSRIFAGRVQPRLPVFLRVIDACTRRLLYFLAEFVDLHHVPEARNEWRRLEKIHGLVANNPLFEMVPRALELEQYAEQDPARPGWIAERLGITLDEEEQTLRDLQDAGFVRWDGKRWVIARDLSVETTRDPRTKGAYLLAHWAQVGAQRIRDGDRGRFAYLVFTTDEETLEALRELQLSYFRSFRALAASATRETRIAVTNLQLFTIDEGA